MKIQYDKLWRLLKDNKMKKKDLMAAAEITAYSMAKLNNDEPVGMEILMRICTVFHCDIGDVMEFIEEL